MKPATPLPWKEPEFVDDHNPYVSDIILASIGGCGCCGSPYGKKADVLYAHHAANTHEELVEALRTLLEAVEGKRVTQGDCNQARHALNAAERK